MVELSPVNTNSDIEVFDTVAPPPPPVFALMNAALAWLNAAVILLFCVISVATAMLAVAKAPFA